MAAVRPYRTLRFSIHGAVAVIALDRPGKLNAYDVAMRDDLYQVLGAIDDDPAVRALVLCGRGPAFSTGGDVSEFGSAPSPVIARVVRRERDVWGRLLGLRAATLAAVHGYAVGGGLEMALLCDVCIAARGTTFSLPECGLGMIPGVGGTQTMPRRVGVGRALAAILTGRSMDAAEALRIGLIARVVPRAQLQQAARACASQLAALDPSVVQAIRRCVRAAHDATLDQGIALEQAIALGLEGRR